MQDQGDKRAILAWGQQLVRSGRQSVTSQDPPSNQSFASRPQEAAQPAPPNEQIHPTNATGSPLSLPLDVLGAEKGERQAAVTIRPPSAVSLVSDQADGAQSRSRKEADRPKLLREYEKHQRYIQELRQMMTRNESEFVRREEELLKALNVIKQRIAAIAASPPTPMFTRSTTDEREVQALQQSLQTLQKDLAKHEEDEQLCGMVVLRMAECIAWCNEQSTSWRGQLVGLMEKMQGIADLSVALRAVAAKTPLIRIGETRPSIPNFTEIKRLPVREELDVLSSVDVTHSALQHLMTALESTRAVVQETHELAEVGIGAMAAAREGAESQLDVQALTIDDAHRALTKLQEEKAYLSDMIRQGEADASEATKQRAAEAERAALMRQEQLEQETKLRTLSESIKREEDEVRQVHADTEQSQRTFERTQDSIKEIRAATTNVERETRELKQMMDSIEQDVAQLRRGKRQLEQACQDVEKEVSRARQKEESVTKSVTDVDAQCASLQTSIDAEHVKLRATERSVVETQTQRDACENDWNRCTAELHELQAKCDELTPIIQALQNDRDVKRDLLSKATAEQKDVSDELELAKMVLTRHNTREGIAPEETQAFLTGIQAIAAASPRPLAVQGGAAPAETQQPANSPNNPFASPTGPARALYRLGAPEPVSAHVPLVQRQTSAGRKRQWSNAPSASADRESTSLSQPSDPENFMFADPNLCSPPAIPHCACTCSNAAACVTVA